MDSRLHRSGVFLQRLNEKCETEVESKTCKEKKQRMHVTVPGVPTEFLLGDIDQGNRQSVIERVHDRARPDAFARPGHHAQNDAD